MTKRGVIFGQKAAEQIQGTVREVSRRMMNEMPHRGRWNVPLENRLRVVVVGTLSAPTSASSAPTTCVGAILKMDPATFLLTPTDDRITIYNYTGGFDASDGTYAKVEFQGVWEVYWVDCNATAAWVGLE